MATKSYPEFTNMAKTWAAHNAFPSSALSGIVGDLAHRLRGGFHISRADQPQTNYSVIRPLDKTGNGPDDAAAGIDMTMSRADMIKCSRSVKIVYSDKQDPRRKYVNAINGWLGDGDATRWDFDANTATYATPDHKWHIHVEIHRKFVRDPAALDAVLSILVGESSADYKKRTTMPTPDKPVLERTAKPALQNSEILKIIREVPKLEQGNKGEFVERYQRLLKIFGHTVTPYGNFGPLTKQTTISLQKTLKRKEDGVVDLTIWCALLFATTNGKIATFPVLRKGDKNAYVKRVQALVGLWGFNMELDGDFGQKTENAVKAVQQQVGIKVDGIVGIDTLIPLMLARKKL